MTLFYGLETWYLEMKNDIPLVFLVALLLLLRLGYASLPIEQSPS
jgi:hypothetical protein